MLIRYAKMKHRLIYVELKSGHADNGPAWIGYADTSKSGRTIYFNDRAFQSCKGGGIGSNYFDVESGDEYWISGIKKEGGDRHWAGGGIISVQREAVDEYLQVRGYGQLDLSSYNVVSLVKGNVKDRVQALENRSA